MPQIPTTTRPTRRLTWPWCAAAAVAACTGSIDAARTPSAGSDPPGSGGAATSPGGPKSSNSADPARAIGPAGLRRLTAVELTNTLRDLVGDPGLALDLPADSRGGSGFDEALVVSELTADHLDALAVQVAAAAVAGLSRIVTCDPAKDGVDACTAKFIDSFGTRAYRRPLTDGERQELAALAKLAAPELQDPFKDRVRLLVRVLVQSPELLYRGAFDQTGATATRALDGYELASRLSYFLWRTMPDAELLAAAADGRLMRRDGLEAQTRRLLASPRARETIQDFTFQLLHLEPLRGLQKDDAHNPLWNVGLREGFDADRRALIDYVLDHGNGALATLLTAPVAFPDAAVAKVYGVAAPSSGPAALDPKRRAGLLTQPSFLAVHADPVSSSPVRRGKTIYSQLLCQTLPPPPSDVPPPKPPAPGQTTRQRFEEHDRNACASACHNLIDPFGFAFEHYDAIGAYRDQDQGQPVDSSATAKLPTEGAKSFADAPGLMAVLADSADVRSCMTRQWLRYALGRAEVDAEEPAVTSLSSAFASAGGDLRELIVSVALAPTFTNTTTAEVKP